MDEKRCGQINIYQFYLKFLRKEFVMQVKYFTDITQQIIKDEIIMARSQHYIIKQIRHRNEITHSQHKPIHQECGTAPGAVRPNDPRRLTLYLP